MKRLLTAGVVAALLSTAAFAGGKKPVKPPVDPPTTYTLDNGVLVLEVTGTSAYSLTEKATGNVLLSKNATTFKIGSAYVTASAITAVTVTTDTLTGLLTLSDSQRVAVVFKFTAGGDLQVTLTPDYGTTVTEIGESFTDVSGTRYYGVWENALPTSLNNAGISAAYDGREVVSTKDVFASSARAPFYLTNRNYGVYVGNEEAGTEAVGKFTFAVSGQTSFSFNSSSLCYTILHGTSPKAILVRHCAVAGGAFMPPDWAFDPIFWRDDYHQLPGVAGIANAQDLILDDAAKLKAHQIRAGAMWIDRPYGTETRNKDNNVGGWGNMDFDSSFPNPPAMAQSLNADGIKLMLWIANKANNSLYTEGVDYGYLCPSYSLSPAIDLSLPNAWEWFSGKLDDLHRDMRFTPSEILISGYKIDRGGEGEMPTDQINAQTTRLHGLAYEQMQGQRGADFFSFTRNINDRGRQYAAVWSGDPKTTWLGFQSSIKNGLRSGLINFPMWGSDTGGYSVSYAISAAQREELFCRWIAFSAYCPMMDIIQGPGRNIFYTYGDATRAIVRKYTDLHHDLIPYTRSAMAEALDNGTPVMRPLFLEFPGDSKVADTWNQYMYGPAIMVAPVTASGATSRSVYMPAGTRWLNHDDGKTVYAGGRSQTISAPRDTLPTLVREGAIIPRGDIVRGNNTWTADWAPSLRVEVFPSSKFGSSFDYWTGAQVETISAEPVSGGFTISGGDLGYTTVLEVRVAGQPTNVTLNGSSTAYSYDSVRGVISVPVSGGFTLTINGVASVFGK